MVERDGHRVRKIDMKTQLTSTIAGTGQAGFSGDGGPAASAELSQPHSITFGPDGDLFICDIANHRVRKVDSAGIISTFAGTGEQAADECADAETSGTCVRLRVRLIAPGSCPAT